MPVPPLVPSPRDVTFSGGAGGALLRADVVVAIDPGLGPEWYELKTGDAESSAVRIRAGDQAGVVRARATLAQLALSASDGRCPAVRIADGPRFGYRGFMLDIARHFQPVETICEVLDLMAELKLNALHLHLTDDQGWRLEIEGRPQLTEVGAATQCGGGAGPGGGGYLTRADYRRIQDYAAALAITVVPEVDVPGHTNAALVAHPELAVDGVVPVPYEGSEAGSSQLDARREETYRFWADVVGQLAEDTDGPYLHLGGDECLVMSEPDAHGVDHAARAAGFVRQGGRLVLSPADAVYLDHCQGNGGPATLESCGPERPSRSAVRSSGSPPRSCRTSGRKLCWGSRPRCSRST